MKFTAPLLTALLTVGSGVFTARAAEPAPRSQFSVMEKGLIASVESATLTAAAPAASERNPLLTFDTEVESGEAAPWFNVILDPHEKFYKAWYGRGGLCYGTSHDGLLWNKPGLDKHPDAAGKKTNLLLPGLSGAGLLREDEESPDWKRLYKLLGTGKDGTTALFSEDGLTWTAPATTKAPAGRVTLAAGLGGKKFTGFFLTKDGLLSAVSDDFTTWSDAKPVATGIEGALSSFHVFTHRTGCYAFATSGGKTSLLHTVDGAAWSAPLPGPWGEVCSVVPQRDDWRLYSTSDRTLTLSTVRAESLAGYTGGKEKPGQLTTRPLPNPGSKLRLTTAIREGGSLTVTVLGEGGATIAGPVNVTEGGFHIMPDLPIPDSVKTITLKFSLLDATLFSFSFGDRQYP